MKGKIKQLSTGEYVVEYTSDLNIDIPDGKGADYVRKAAERVIKPKVTLPLHPDDVKYAFTLVGVEVEFEPIPTLDIHCFKTYAKLITKQVTIIKTTSLYHCPHCKNGFLQHVPEDEPWSSYWICSNCDSTYNNLVEAGFDNLESWDEVVGHFKKAAPLGLSFMDWIQIHYHSPVKKIN